MTALISSNYPRVSINGASSPATINTVYTDQLIHIDQDSHNLLKNDDQMTTQTSKTASVDTGTQLDAAFVQPAPASNVDVQANTRIQRLKISKLLWRHVARERKTKRVQLESSLMTEQEAHRETRYTLEKAYQARRTADQTAHEFASKLEDQAKRAEVAATSLAEANTRMEAMRSELEAARLETLRCTQEKESATRRQKKAEQQRDDARRSRDEAIENSSKNNTHLQDQISQLEVHKTQLELENSVLKDDLTKQRDDTRKLKDKKIENTSNENVRLQNQKLQLEGENTQLQHGNSSLQDDVTKLREEIANLKNSAQVPSVTETREAPSPPSVPSVLTAPSGGLAAVDGGIFARLAAESKSSRTTTKTPFRVGRAAKKGQVQLGFARLATPQSSSAIDVTEDPMPELTKSNAEGIDISDNDTSEPQQAEASSKSRIEVEQTASEVVDPIPEHAPNNSGEFDIGDNDTLKPQQAKTSSKPAVEIEQSTSEVAENLDNEEDLEVVEEPESEEEPDSEETSSGQGEVEPKRTYFEFPGMPHRSSSEEDLLLSSKAHFDSSKYTKSQTSSASKSSESKTEETSSRLLLETDVEPSVAKNLADEPEVGKLVEAFQASSVCKPRNTPEGPLSEHFDCQNTAPTAPVDPSASLPIGPAAISSTDNLSPGGPQSPTQVIFGTEPATAPAKDSKACSSSELPKLIISPPAVDAPTSKTPITDMIAPVEMPGLLPVAPTVSSSGGNVMNVEPVSSAENTSETQQLQLSDTPTKKVVDAPIEAGGLSLNALGKQRERPSGQDMVNHLQAGPTSSLGISNQIHATTQAVPNKKARKPKRQANPLVMKPSGNRKAQGSSSLTTSASQPILPPSPVMLGRSSVTSSLGAGPSVDKVIPGPSITMPISPEEDPKQVKISIPSDDDNDQGMQWEDVQPRSSLTTTQEVAMPVTASSHNLDDDIQMSIDLPSIDGRNMEQVINPAEDDVDMDEKDASAPKKAEDVDVQMAMTADDSHEKEALKDTEMQDTEVVEPTAAKMDSDMTDADPSTMKVGADLPIQKGPKIQPTTPLNDAQMLDTEAAPPAITTPDSDMTDVVAMTVEISANLPVKRHSISASKNLFAFSSADEDQRRLQYADPTRPSSQTLAGSLSKKTPTDPSPSSKPESSSQHQSTTKQDLTKPQIFNFGALPSPSGIADKVSKRAVPTIFRQMAHGASLKKPAPKKQSGGTVSQFAAPPGGAFTFGSTSTEPKASESQSLPGLFSRESAEKAPEKTSEKESDKDSEDNSMSVSTPLSRTETSATQKQAAIKADGTMPQTPVANTVASPSGVGDQISNHQPVDPSKRRHMSAAEAMKKPSATPHSGLTFANAIAQYSVPPTHERAPALPSATTTKASLLSHENLASIIEAYKSSTAKTPTASKPTAAPTQKRVEVSRIQPIGQPAAASSCLVDPTASQLELTPEARAAIFACNPAGRPLNQMQQPNGQANFTLPLFDHSIDESSSRFTRKR